MVLIRDELAGLFANMSRYSGGSDRPFWLEAWDGVRHVVERVSGSIVIEHLLVGVIGCFQPDKLARAFAGDEDGMCGRFVYAWPSAPDYRPLTNEAAEVEPELQSALTALIRLPSEDVEGAFTPQTICLSDGARAEFEGFRKWVDNTKRGLDGHERQWLVKGETVVLRLAGTLAYMAWAISLGAPPTNGLDGITGSLEPRTIDKQFMTAAIRLWMISFGHMRARSCDRSDRAIATGKHAAPCDGSRATASTRSRARIFAVRRLDKSSTPSRPKACSTAWRRRAGPRRTRPRQVAAPSIAGQSTLDYSWINLRKLRKVRKVYERGRRRCFPHFAHFPHPDTDLRSMRIFLSRALLPTPVGNSSGIGGIIECRRRRDFRPARRRNSRPVFVGGPPRATRACNSAVALQCALVFRFFLDIAVRGIYSYHSSSYLSAAILDFYRWRFAKGVDHRHVSPVSPDIQPDGSRERV